MAELRMPRINRVLVSGRITNDIDIRYTAKGTPVVRFTLAVDKTVKDATGQYQNQASFIEIVAWSKWAETLANSAHKGSPVIVEGRIETRSYVDSNNNNRKSVEVIAEYIQFLEARHRQDENPPADNPESEVPMPEDEAPHAQVTNDDVPF